MLKERERERERERDNSNSKTLILKDSSVRSVWAYLTASPRYTTERERVCACVRACVRVCVCVGRGSGSEQWLG